MLLRAILKIIGFTFLGISTAYSSRPSYKGPEVNFIAISPKDSNIVYAGTRKGIFKSTNQGQSWVFSKGFSTDSVMSLVIDTLHPNILYAGKSHGIYKSPNAGRSWKSSNRGLIISDDPAADKSYIPAITEIAVNPKSSKIVIASAVANDHKKGYLFLSDNGGSHWRRVYTGDQVYTLEFNPEQPEFIFAGTSNGLIKSIDGGLTWQPYSPPLLYENKPVGFMKLKSFNIEKQILYAAGIGLMKSEDAGVNWQKISPTAHTVSCESETCSSNIADSTEEARLLRLQKEIATDGNCSNFAVAASTPNILYANCLEPSISTTSYSALIKSTDYGNSWIIVGQGLPKEWFAPALTVDPNHPEVVFASWANGGLYRSMDGGETWQESDEGLVDIQAVKK